MLAGFSRMGLAKPAGDSQENAKTKLAIKSMAEEGKREKIMSMQ